MRNRTREAEDGKKNVSGTKPKLTWENLHDGFAAQAPRHWRNAQVTERTFRYRTGEAVRVKRKSIKVDPKAKLEKCVVWIITGETRTHLVCSGASWLPS